MLVDPTQVDAFIAAVREAYSLGGWLAVLPMVVLVVVNAYKLPAVQALFPQHAQWTNLPRGVQLSAVFLTSFAVALASHLGKASLLGVLITAGITAVTAAVSFVTTKPLARSHVVSAWAAKTPEPMTRALSLLAPLDLSRIAVIRNGAANAKHEP